jgi:hypothetical protein
MGMAEAVTESVVILAYSETEAKTKPFAEWKKNVRPGFAKEEGITSFAKLNDWNGARVCKVAVGKAFVWEELS